MSVEVALKMAWQAQRRPAAPTKMFTVRGGYHGDTFSPMSVCDPDGGMHAHVRRGAARARLRRRATGRRGDDAARRRGRPATTALFEQHADEIAAVIVEPVLQGAGGMHVYDPRAARTCAELAREHGALVIHDEIATGLLAHRHALGGRPAEGRADIVCVGKALTGGYLTLAATLCTAEVAAAASATRRRRDDARADVHGATRWPARSRSPASTCSGRTTTARNIAAHRGRRCATGSRPLRGPPGASSTCAPSAPSA